MEITNQSVIGKIVAQNYVTADVFKKYGIDFCCNGHRTLETASDEKNISAQALITELNDVLTATESSEDYNSWEYSFLIDYIYNAHHVYIRTQAPDIMEYLDIVCEAHGTHHPELFEVRKIFLESVEDISNHLQKEEQVLFPMIKAMETSEKEGTPLEECHCGTINNPIRVMMTEHDVEGGRYREISGLTNNYTVPSDGCTTYGVLLEKLRAFEANLHKHVHLENNILFPRAAALEEKLSASK